MMKVSRKEFVGGVLAFAGRAACPQVAASGGRLSSAAASAREDTRPPNLRFGVVSDVHIGGKPDAAEQLEKVLRWFASKNVDAVLCPGDIAHSGLIDELEKFATAWYKVFPDGKRADGSKVELMISTGNHDVDAWGGRWKNFTEEQMDARRFNWKDNPQKTWRRLFGQDWSLIWRREVKGYTFIGAQWSSLKPPIADYFKAHAAELGGAKPFFYCQHAHPKGTCHTGFSGVDNGESVRALTPFPNAVAITGHSHYAISDERTVWQGAFTSIGAGCMHEGFAGFEYDNVSASWRADSRKKLMASLADPKPWGGDAKAGCCELVEVFDDHLVIHRQSVKFGLPIGPAWVVPIGGVRGAPALPNATFDFASRKARRKEQGAIPQFAGDAKIEAKFCPNGHALESAAHKGEPCIYVTFPRAQTVKGSRVFDYLVEASRGPTFVSATTDAQERVPPVTRKIIAAGFAYPEEYANLPGECLFSVAEISPDKPIRFTVTPRDCFGLAGRSLVSTIALSK